MANSEFYYNAQIESLNTEDEHSRERLRDNLGRALKEAYISTRLARRDLPQQLAAKGIHGGLAETSIVDLRNQYLRGRSEQERDYQSKLGDWQLDYSRRMAVLKAGLAELQSLRASGGGGGGAAVAPATGARASRAAGEDSTLWDKISTAMSDSGYSTARGTFDGGYSAGMDMLKKCLKTGDDSYKLYKNRIANAAYYANRYGTGK